MVWGLTMPSSFGMFFPDGEYVGWDEQKAAYFENELSVGQKSFFAGREADYGFYVTDKLIYEPWLEARGELPPYSPIEPGETPKRFVIARTYASLGSMIKTVNRILAVDEALKALIEQFEPGMHQFFPLEIVMADGSVYAKPYFIFVIGQYIESFNKELSDPQCWRYGEFKTNAIVETDKRMTKLAFSKQAVGKAHFWRERRVIPDLYCFSDALMAAIDRAGLRLPRRYRLKEV